MDKKDNALSPTAVLESAISKIEAQYDCKRITLDRRIYSEIADALDCHYHIVGCMGYDSFIMLTGIGKKTWALAVGIKDNGYPGKDKFASDLIAVKLEESMTEESMKLYFSAEVQHGEYWRNTLIIGTVPGYLGASKNSVFGTKAINDSLKEMIANEAIVNNDVITLSGDYVFHKKATYHPEAIDQVVQNIISILGKR